jgi:molybdate transport system substrate-binding protein
MRKLCWTLLVFLLNLTAPPGFSAPGAPTAGHEITVAAAADLNSALTEIAAGFKQQTGITVKLSFGASGALAQQIQNGAPFRLVLFS